MAFIIIAGATGTGRKPGIKTTKTPRRSGFLAKGPFKMKGIKKLKKSKK